MEKLRADTNSRLKNYGSQKNSSLINHDNIKENNLGVKKLHLNRKGNRNKFDLLSGQVKGSIDILMVSETKLDDSFPEG